MTIGKLLEMLYGSVGVVHGEMQDATPFFNVSAKWALEELLKQGYSDSYTMISGTTGEVYDKPWFLGVCFYQRLKHHVLDKVAARARGVRAVLTRQPVDGRANNGGQKVRKPNVQRKQAKQMRDHLLRSFLRKQITKEAKSTAFDVFLIAFPLGYYFGSLRSAARAHSNCSLARWSLTR